MADERNRRRPVTAKEAHQHANEVVAEPMAAICFRLYVGQGESAKRLVDEAREVAGCGVALRPKLTPAAKPAASDSSLRRFAVNEPGRGGKDQAGLTRAARRQRSEKRVFVDPARRRGADTQSLD